MGKEKGPDSVVGRQGKVLEKVMKSRGVVRQTSVGKGGSYRWGGETGRANAWRGYVRTWDFSGD